MYYGDINEFLQLPGSVFQVQLKQKILWDTNQPRQWTTAHFKYIEDKLWNEDGTGQRVRVQTRFSPELGRNMYDLLDDKDRCIGCFEVQAFDCVENGVAPEYAAPEPEPEPEPENSFEAVPIPNPFGEIHEGEPAKRG